MATRDLTLNIHEKREGNAMLQAANDLEKLSRGVDAAGDKFKGAATDLEKLDKQIVASKAHITDLRTQFARTGDTSLFGDLRKEEANLRNLERVFKGLVKDAGTLGQAISSGMSAGMSTGNIMPEHVKGVLIAGLIGLGAITAPAIGAMVAGAVAGTVAGGGVIGGIIAASADSRVKAAWHDLASEFTAESFGGGAFVQQTLDGIVTIKQAIEGIDLKSMFSQAAPAVDELAEGIAGFIANLGPGLSAAFAESEKYSQVFGEGLADAGAALSSFMRSILASPGTIEGLKFGLMILNGTIIATGQFLGWLSDKFHDMVAFNARLSGAAEDVFGWVPWLGSRIRDMNDNMEEVQTAGKEASDGGGAFADVIKRMIEPTTTEAERLKALNDELFRTATAGMAVDAAADSLAADFMNLADSVAENGNSLDQWEQQGNKNRVMVRGMMDDLIATRQANIAANMPVEEANRLFIEQANALQNKLSVELGFAADQVSDLIGQYKLIPTVVTTEFRALYTKEMGYGGGEHSGLGDERDRKAAGGYVSAGMSYLVGDGGRAEVFTPSSNGYVSPSAGAWAAAGMGGGGGGAQMELVIRSGGSAMDDLLVQIISKAVQVRGGDGAVIGITTVRG